MTLNEHLDVLARLPSPDERRAIRERLNVTQRQIADHLGVTAQAVTAWEHGTTPGPRHLAAYVSVLDTLRRRAEQAVA